MAKKVYKSIAVFEADRKTLQDIAKKSKPEKLISDIVSEMLLARNGKPDKEVQKLNDEIVVGENLISELKELCVKKDERIAELEKQIEEGTPEQLLTPEMHKRLTDVAKSNDMTEEAMLTKLLSVVDKNDFVMVIKSKETKEEMVKTVQTMLKSGVEKEKISDDFFLKTLTSKFNKA